MNIYMKPVTVREIEKAQVIQEAASELVGI